MTATQVIKLRRERISFCLAKSMTSPIQIAIQLNAPDKEGKKPDVLVEAKTISNDLAWMKKNSIKWLSGWALDGYVFETQNTIQVLKDFEIQLQSIRSKASSTDEIIKIIHELKEVVNMRWVMQGEGPALMHNKYVSTQAK